MSTEFPCNECVVRAGCTKCCDDAVNFYSLLIKDYFKHRDTSSIFKSFSKEQPQQTEFMKAYLKTNDKITISHKVSGESFTIDKDGRIVYNAHAKT